MSGNSSLPSLPTIVESKCEKVNGAEESLRKNVELESVKADSDRESGERQLAAACSPRSAAAMALSSIAQQLPPPYPMKRKVASKSIRNLRQSPSRFVTAVDPPNSEIPHTTCNIEPSRHTPCNPQPNLAPCSTMNSKQEQLSVQNRNQNKQQQVTQPIDIAGSKNQTHVGKATSKKDSHGSQEQSNQGSHSQSDVQFAPRMGPIFPHGYPQHYHSSRMFHPGRHPFPSGHPHSMHQYPTPWGAWYPQHHSRMQPPLPPAGYPPTANRPYYQHPHYHHQLLISTFSIFGYHKAHLPFEGHAPTVARLHNPYYQNPNATARRDSISNIRGACLASHNSNADQDSAMIGSDHGRYGPLVTPTPHKKKARPQPPTPCSSSACGPSNKTLMAATKSAQKDDVRPPPAFSKPSPKEINIRDTIHIPARTDGAFKCNGIRANDYQNTMGSSTSYCAVNSIPSSIAAYSRKTKSLGVLAEGFCQRFSSDSGPFEIVIDFLAKDLGVERRRIYDVVNILESVRMVLKRGKNTYEWKGFDHLPYMFALMQQEAISKYKEHAIRQNILTASELAIKEEEKKQGDPVQKNYQMLNRLSQLFLQVFLAGYTTISLPEASDLIHGCTSTAEDLAALGCKSGNRQECAIPTDPKELQQAAARGLKTKIRRLYDIANVFCAVGILKKADESTSCGGVGTKRKSEASLSSSEENDKADLKNLSARRPLYSWSFHLHPKELPRVFDSMPSYMKLSGSPFTQQHDDLGSKKHRQNPPTPHDLHISTNGPVMQCSVRQSTITTLGPSSDDSFPNSNVPTPSPPSILGENGALISRKPRLSPALPKSYDQSSPIVSKVPPAAVRLSRLTETKKSNEECVSTVVDRNARMPFSSMKATSHFAFIHQIGGADDTGDVLDSNCSSSIDDHVNSNEKQSYPEKPISKNSDQYLKSNHQDQQRQGEEESATTEAHRVSLPDESTG